MSNFRLSKDTTAHYTSFSDLAKSFGCRPVSKRTRDIKKLEKQKESFLKTCSVCGSPFKYHMDTNVLTCSNPGCQGIKVVVSRNPDGTENILYRPVVRTVDETGMEIGMNLFA